MKLKLYHSLLLVGALGMTSCNLDVDNSKNYETRTFNTCNLVIPAQGEAMASTGSYSMTIYPYENQLKLSTTDLNLDGNLTGFATSNMKASFNTYVDGLTYYEVIDFSGGLSNTTGVTISNLKGFSSYFANFPFQSDPIIPGYPTTFFVPFVTQYEINGNYTVKTFMRDAIYDGMTTITTLSDGSQYINEDIRYRVFFNDDFKTADVIFYTAKFAPNMPITIYFVLEDLEVNFNRNGYTISIPAGEKVIPQWLEGGSLTPFPAYQFSRFMLTTANDELTSVMINYTVESGNNTFNVSFQGAYVTDGKKQE